MPMYVKCGDKWIEEQRKTVLQVKYITEIDRYWYKQFRHGLNGGYYDRGIHLTRMHSLTHGYGQHDGHFVDEIKWPKIEVCGVYGFNAEEFRHLVGKKFDRNQLSKEETCHLIDNKTRLIEEEVLHD